MQILTKKRRQRDRLIREIVDKEKEIIETLLKIVKCIAIRRYAETNKRGKRRLIYRDISKEENI